jgi:predicted DNA-binding protein (MmcQ/YjbR family)
MVAGSQRDRVMAACGTKPGSAEDYPFGDEVAVFKVAGRMFALVPLGPAPGSVSLKCDPGLAADLRGRYAAITPGYHLNKRHWNTVALDGSVPDEEVLELVDHSYDLVLAGLTRAQRNKLPPGEMPPSSQRTAPFRHGTGQQDTGAGPLATERTG